MDEREEGLAERVAAMSPAQLAQYLYDRRSGCGDPSCRVCKESRAVYDALMEVLHGKPC